MGEKIKSMGFPPRIERGKGWALDKDADLIEGKIIQYVLTADRVMRPEFGLGVDSMIFKGNIDEKAILSELQEYFGDYILDVEVSKIDTALYIVITWTWKDEERKTVIII